MKPDSPKNRLLDTAKDLFKQRGFPSVGINEITDKADVARMTLYNNFESKEALAVAAFQKLSQQRKEQIAEALDGALEARAKVLALFDLAEVFASEETFCGCAFINLAAQVVQPSSELHNLVAEHKNWFKKNLENSLNDIRQSHRKRVALQLLVLWDGALVEAFIQRSLEPIHAASFAGTLIITFALEETEIGN
ncbi:TetR/AcrR family transcriptional regulator [Alphaproteobacteria bacterium]|nr:TetR/AcrR family transcriptional regulator [Alphaproteobacteria bacterium]